MRLIAYQALVSSSASVARIQEAQARINALGGRVRLGPTTKTGLVTVFLELPERWRPADVLPEVPFYPV